MTALRGLYDYAGYLSERTGEPVTTDQVIEYLLARKNTLDDDRLAFTITNGHISHWPLNEAGELEPEDYVPGLNRAAALEYAAYTLRVADPEEPWDDSQSYHRAAMRLDREREKVQRS